MTKHVQRLVVFIITWLYAISMNWNARGLIGNFWFSSLLLGIAFIIYSSYHIAKGRLSISKYNKLKCITSFLFHAVLFLFCFMSIFLLISLFISFVFSSIPSDNASSLSSYWDWVLILSYKYLPVLLINIWSSRRLFKEQKLNIFTPFLYYLIYFIFFIPTIYVASVFAVDQKLNLLFVGIVLIFQIYAPDAIYTVLNKAKIY